MKTKACSRQREQRERRAAGCGWCSRVRVEVQGEGRCLHLPLGDGARHACDRLRLCEALCVPAVLERVEEALLLPLEGHLRVLCPLEDRRLVSRTSCPRPSVCRSLLSLCTRAETAGRPGASPHAGCRLGYTSATPRLHLGYISPVGCRRPAARVQTSRPREASRPSSACGGRTRLSDPRATPALSPGEPHRSHIASKGDALACTPLSPTFGSDARPSARQSE